MAQDNVICIKKILEINSTNEAFLRYISAHIDYALDALNAEHTDIVLDVLELLRDFLPEPEEYDIDCFRSELLDFYERTPADGGDHG
jgi:hypothetical protein